MFKHFTVYISNATLKVFFCLQIANQKNESKIIVLVNWNPNTHKITFYHQLLYHLYLFTELVCLQENTVNSFLLTIITESAKELNSQRKIIKLISLKRRSISHPHINMKKRKNFSLSNKFEPWDISTSIFAHSFKTAMNWKKIISGSLGNIPIKIPI